MPSYPSLYQGTTPVIRTPLGAIDSPWTRPSAWPTLPDPTGKQIFYGLYAVENTDANHVAILATTSTGTYDVIWGDGNRDAGVTSNVQAEHSYTYSSLSSYPEWNGYRLVQVALSANTGNITGINLQRRASTGTLSALQTNMGVNWLEVDMNIPNATSLTIGGNTNVAINKLQRARIRQNSVTSFANLFHSAYDLESVQIDSMSACTSTSRMFQACYKLKYAPDLDTSNSTDFTSFFQDCYMLQSIPRYNTSKGTLFYFMFYGCRSLQSIPLLDTGKGTRFDYMFAYATSLLTIPLINTLSGTNFSYMFNAAQSLVTIPQIDTRNGTDFSNMFNTTVAIKTIPLLDLGKATTTASMFSNALSLVSVPLLNLSNVANTSLMFNNCNALTGVPDFDTRNVTNANQMFNNCFNMIKSPTINLSANTNITNIFANCYTLTEIPVLDCRNITNSLNAASPFGTCRSLSKAGTTNLNLAHSYTNCRLSRDAIVTIFNNLSSVGTARNINVSGNWGALSLTAADRAIATGKNWTITG